MSERSLNKITYYLFRDLFFISLSLLLFLLIIEDIQPGFVSFWLEIKYILLIVFISGLMVLIATFKKK